MFNIEHLRKSGHYGQAHVNHTHFLSLSREIPGRVYLHLPFINRCYTGYEKRFQISIALHSILYALW